jgi:hypothetical protein
MPATVRPALRRLRLLQRAVAPAGCAPAQGQQVVAEVETADAWAFEALAQGRLDPATVDPALLRRLMQPEPDGPTEVERIMAGLP